jgi:uncharacterized protein (TIGR03000 family)
MLRKCFLVPVLASIVLLALAVDVAQAQRLRERRMERRDTRRGVVYDQNYSDPLLATSTNQGMSGLAPTMVQSNTNARISFYPTPNATLNDCCQISVIVPDMQAKVYFDGKATSSTGMTRTFDTPALQGTCTYTVRCEWMENGQKLGRDLTLTCMPNRQCVVDFTAPARTMVR